MLLILEGADGVGKTTLARRLQKEIFASNSGSKVQVTYMHRGVPTQHPLDEYVTPLFGYRPNTHSHIICDRWHVGELVYPRILNRPTQLDEAVALYLELQLQSLGAVIVHVDAPKDVVAARLAQRQDEEPPPHVKVSDAFRSALNAGLTSWNVFSPLGDTNSQAYAHAVAELIGHARVLTTYASRVADFTSYVGHPEPHTLLVGAVQHDLRDATPKEFSAAPLGPAFMPYQLTSGHFLLSTLGLLTRRWRQGLGLIDVNDDIELFCKTRLARNGRVVALGREAHDKLTQMCVSHGAVPHPQFMRQSHHNSREAYAAVILEANTGKDLLSWRP